MEKAQLCVVYGALIIGSLCFLIYLVDALLWLWSRPKVVRTANEAATTAADLTRKGPGTDRALIGVDDMAGLAEALAKLGEVLIKAGPALTSLLGAVLFYAVAAAGAVTSTAAEEPKAKVKTNTVEADKAPAGAVGDVPPAKPKLPPPTTK